MYSLRLVAMRAVPGAKARCPAPIRISSEPYCWSKAHDCVGLRER